MNQQEAKFILGAFRPDGRDATDAMFAEALALVERDPELRQWLERQRTFDRAMVDRLGAIAPPAELKPTILAGGRASRPLRKWWANSPWLAAAAAIVLIATASISLVLSTRGPGLSEFSAIALKDTVAAHDEHAGSPAPLAGVQARLAQARLPLLAAAAIDLAELRRHNCRSVRFRGREIFEVCFQRDGTWFHLYAARREDFSSGAPLDAKTLVTSVGGNASAAWSDAKNVYALVTEAGEAALRRLI